MREKVDGQLVLAVPNPTSSIYRLPSLRTGVVLIYFLPIVVMCKFIAFVFHSEISNTIATAIFSVVFLLPFAITAAVNIWLDWQLVAKERALVLQDLSARQFELNSSGMKIPFCAVVGNRRKRMLELSQPSISIDWPKIVSWKIENLPELTGRYYPMIRAWFNPGYLPKRYVIVLKDVPEDPLLIERAMCDSFEDSLFWYARSRNCVIDE